MTTLQILALFGVLIVLWIGAALSSTLLTAYFSARTRTLKRMDAAQSEALEDAARLMEQIEAPGPSLAAEAIRALKDKP